VACRPEHVPGVLEALRGLSWAQVHHRDALGRLVVTIDAADGGASASHIRELQQLPHVLMAELVEYVSEAG
jgi:nitrate reductase NapAB chaperone NapD